MDEIIERLSDRNRKILQQYETVEMWISKRCGSWRTARYYISTFARFCELQNINPDEIVKKWRDVRYDWKEREKFLDEWNEKIENYYALMNLAPLSKLTQIATIVSFFRSYKIPVEIETNRHTYARAKMLLFLVRQGFH